MDLIEFNNLTHAQKSDIVWEWGYYIANRKEGACNMVLFLVQDFFVVVSIDVSSNETINIQGVLKSEIHKDFLSQVNQQHPILKAA